MEIIILHSQGDKIRKIISDVIFVSKKPVRDFYVYKKHYIQIEKISGYSNIVDVIISEENTSAKLLESCIKPGGKILFDSSKPIKYKFFRKKRLVVYKIDAVNNEFKILGSFVKLMSLPLKYAQEVAKMHNALEDFNFGYKNLKRC